MTVEKLRARIEECIVLVGFEYHGKRYSIEPCYDPDEKRQEYLIYIENDTEVLYDIDEVMNRKMFDGKALSEIVDEIVIVEF